MKDETDGLLNEVLAVGSGRQKLKARFSLSRRAKKTTDRLIEHRNGCKSKDDDISQPRPPAAREAVPLETTYEFESRKQIEEQLMATLVGGDVNLVGICGMGGLGKTTMAKRIMNRALENKAFDEVVMAVVSQPPVNKLKIQVEVGRSLGFSGLKDETSEDILAKKLHARLSDTKRTLLALDDVWEKLELEHLGIPCNHKGCSILFTSRNSDVLRAMKVEKVFGMEELSVEDSWFLFRQTTGTCVDNSELTSVAKEVVNECKELPIALKTVGALLRDETDLCTWRSYLWQLGQCDPNIPGMIVNVYNPLKLSYDVLDTEQKSVFLLCGLYPEDADISIVHLNYFCMGLGIFKGGIRNVEAARYRMRALAKMLKSRSLLLDSEEGDDNRVRMHDVVREVCIFIAEKEGYIGGNDCTWISSSQRLELPSRLGIPNLRLFLCIDNHNREFEFNSWFCEGIIDLSALCIHYCSFTSLPRTTQPLKNLNTLVLDSCHELETLFVVGELVNLEIFVCRNCQSIEKLPLEMQGLNRLRLLDLTECYELQRISRGIIQV